MSNTRFYPKAGLSAIVGKPESRTRLDYALNALGETTTMIMYHQQHASAVRPVPNGDTSLPD